MFFAQKTDYKFIDKALLDDVAHFAVQLNEANDLQLDRLQMVDPVPAATTALAHQVFLRACELKDYLRLPEILDDTKFVNLQSPVIYHPAKNADDSAAMLVDQNYKHCRSYHGSGIFTTMGTVSTEDDRQTYTPFKLQWDSRILSEKELLIDIEKRGRISSSFTDPVMIELFDYIDGLDRQSKMVLLNTLKANPSLVGVLINLDAIDYSQRNWAGEKVAVLNRGKLCVSQSCYDQTLESSPKYKSLLEKGDD